MRRVLATLLGASFFAAISASPTAASPPPPGTHWSDMTCSDADGAPAPIDVRVEGDVLRSPYGSIALTELRRSIVSDGSMSDAVDDMVRLTDDTAGAAFSSMAAAHLNGLFRNGQRAAFESSYRSPAVRRKAIQHLMARPPLIAADGVAACSLNAVIDGRTYSVMARAPSSTPFALPLEVAQAGRKHQVYSVPLALAVSSLFPPNSVARRALDGSSIIAQTASEVWNALATARTFRPEDPLAALAPCARRLKRHLFFDGMDRREGRQEWRVLESRTGHSPFGVLSVPIDHGALTCDAGRLLADVGIFDQVMSRRWIVRLADDSETKVEIGRFPGPESGSSPDSVSDLLVDGGEGYRSFGLVVDATTGGGRWSRWLANASGGRVLWYFVGSVPRMLPSSERPRPCPHDGPRTDLMCVLAPFAP